jgi:Pyruvate/2-oxoacid:ferredoxin oxidoreductase gamma subunit
VTLARELRLVIAGSAGERVQSAAGLFCQAALVAGLYATQKNDNPVTQGTGFSLAEVCLSSEPIEYTGMGQPDAVIIASSDGWRELDANGTFARCQPGTLLLEDAELPDPPAAGRLLRLPLRKAATPKQAALAGVAAWLERDSVLPGAIWEAGLMRLPSDRRQAALEAVRIGQQLATREGEGKW